MSYMSVLHLYSKWGWYLTFMHFPYNFNDASIVYAQANDLRMSLKCNNWLQVLYSSHLYTIIWCIKVSSTCMGRNFWLLKPITVYNMGSNGKLISVLIQAVSVDPIKFINWGITAGTIWGVLPSSNHVQLDPYFTMSLLHYHTPVILIAPALPKRISRK